MSQSAMDELFEICFITKMQQYTRSKYILRYTLLNIEYILTTLLSQCSNFYVSHLSSMLNKEKTCRQSTSFTTAKLHSKC